jgi:hypothetical protein
MEPMTAPVPKAPTGERRFKGVVSPRRPKTRKALQRDFLGAGLDTGAHPSFIYHGGPIVNTPQVHALFVGDWMSASNQNRATRLKQFLTDLMNSKYMNILSQYGCGTTGRLVSSAFVAAPDNDLSGPEIQGILQTAIDNGTIPEPTNPSQVHVLFLADAVGVNDTMNGIVMCEAASDNAFGYHDFFETSAGQLCVFAVVPGLTDTCVTTTCPVDSTCSLKRAQTQEQRQTQVASHEFAEMISNPLVGLDEGWSEPTSTHENGDICNGLSGTITVGSNTWTVQLMYSKKDDMNTNGATTCIAEKSSPIASLLPPHSSFQASPAACTWGPGRLDFFGISSKGQMYQRAWIGTRFGSSWVNLGGSFQGSPAVVSWGPDRLDFFGVGTNGHMFQRAWTGSAFGGWVDLGGGFQGSPAVCSWGPDRLDFFGVGTNGHMCQRAWTGSAFGGWVDLGGNFQGSPAVCSWGPDRLDFFGVGRDGHMYQRAWAGTAFGGWVDVGDAP